MSGETTGAVRVVLQLEGLLVLIAACVAYSKFGLGWGTFALWFLAPDLSFFGFIAGPKVGAIAYNSAHSYIGAICCISAGLLVSAPILLGAGMIWCAHIGFDRALGYGLKYATGFGFTHLGRKGPKTADSPSQRGESQS
jgi:Domain of unknown function (DUF4260)